MKMMATRISVKIAVVTTVISWVALCLISWFSYQKDIVQIQESHFNIIEAMGKNIAPYIDADVHKNISNHYQTKNAVTQDQEPPEYAALRKPLTLAHKQNNLKTPMYTLVLTDSLKEKIKANPDVMHVNGTEFIMFSRGVYFRHVYDYKPEMKAAFFQGKISRAQPYQDKHGEWISMYFPLKDTQGDIVGILEIDDEMTDLYAANTLAFRKGLIILLILSLVSSIIMWLVTRYIIAPLGKLTQAAKIFGKGDYNTKISVPGSDEINTLAQVMDKARSDISGFINRILDVIPSIMLTFDREGNILPHASRTSRILLNKGQDLTGKKVGDLVFHESSEWRELLKLAFSKTSKMPFTSLMELAPEFLEIQDKKFKLNFLPIYNGDELENIFMFGLDVTNETTLKNKMEQDNRNNRMYMELIRNQNLFEGFLVETEKNLSHSKSILIQPIKKPEEIAELFRIFHTIKGSSASLKILTVSETAHELESLLRKLQTGDTGNIYIQVSKKMHELELKLKDVVEQFQKLSGSGQNGVLVEPWELQELKKVVRAGNLDKALKTLENLSLPSLNEYIKAKSELVFNQTLESMDKKARLDFELDHARVSKETIHILEPVLIHTIRNSLDHGLEESELRADAGKPVTGHLKVSSRISNQKLEIHISDDGGGIDTDKVLAQAVEKQVISESKAGILSQKEILQLIFTAGFSTSENVSEISGRGVGMDAVKKILEENEGTLELKSEKGKGTRFIATIPLT